MEAQDVFAPKPSAHKLNVKDVKPAATTQVQFAAKKSNWNADKFIGSSNMNALKKLSLIAFLLKVAYDYSNGVYFDSFFGALWVGLVALYLYLFVSNGMNFGESSTNRIQVYGPLTDEAKTFLLISAPLYTIALAIAAIMKRVEVEPVIEREYYRYNNY
ncbi:hypothetical protein BJ508DRAFT_300961 [Ascobolus immersus RN42]|uniref:Uncharacterized protein n=1 Tax=Ascobolus immersus RN42 TaxID=1160509 RepID=A0A3N4ITY3_ASCIM|nr:hypothetical protein BJ508DRAFT_300961 [Ascobolus immersus RN42]